MSARGLRRAGSGAGAPVVFTVRLAPSLIAGLRRLARSRGQTRSATLAEAVGLYSVRLTSGVVARAHLLSPSQLE